jgi:hypothetical protein
LRRSSRGGRHAASGASCAIGSGCSKTGVELIEYEARFNRLAALLRPGGLPTDLPAVHANCGRRAAFAARAAPYSMIRATSSAACEPYRSAIRYSVVSMHNMTPPPVMTLPLSAGSRPTAASWRRSPSSISSSRSTRCRHGRRRRATDRAQSTDLGAPRGELHGCGGRIAFPQPAARHERIATKSGENSQERVQRPSTADIEPGCSVCNGLPHSNFLCRLPLLI